MNKYEEFNSRREYINKYPSGIYICSYCKNPTPNPYICPYCGGQANKLIHNEETYRYLIKGEQKEIQQIFKPVELIKEGEKKENE